MLRRLVISFIVAVSIVGTAESTSASAEQRNNRMWKAIENSDAPALLRLFGFEEKLINDRLIPERIKGFRGSKPYINAKMDGTTPLLWAVDNDPSIIPTLMFLGADPNLLNDDLNKTPLTRAVELENEDVVAYLLANGADSNLAPVLAPLSIAVQSGNEKLVSLLAPLTYTYTIINDLEFAGAVENSAIQRILIKALEAREAASKEAQELLQ